MIALLDINVLIALFDTAHVHHQSAQTWLSGHRSSGWATCPITENGCIRILSQHRYPGALPISDITRRLRAATDAADHTFWSDTISLCDRSRFEIEQILSSKSLTDLYLLALAAANNGRLVTFDRTIPRGAVVGAQPKHIVAL